VLFSVAFPPISHLFEWPDIFFKDTWFAINKVALINIGATVLILAFFFLAARKGQLVPRGIQNLAEVTVDFVRNGIVMQTMGPSGLVWAPFLTLLFLFIFVNNITKVIPPIIMPANGRIAGPMVLALLVYVIWNFEGIRHRALAATSRTACSRRACPRRSTCSSPRSSFSRPSSSGPSRTPCDSSPT
jgi:F-type H+-transporting ATPase subunit a